jgi:hypothetical protein
MDGTGLNATASTGDLYATASTGNVSITALEGSVTINAPDNTTGDATITATTGAAQLVLNDAAGVSLSSGNSGAAISINAPDAAVNISAGSTGITIQAPSSGNNLQLNAPLTVIELIGGQRVKTIFVNNANYPAGVADYAITMTTSGGTRTLTLPTITGTNVGKQFLVLHSTGVSTLSVSASGGQTIYSSTGAATANPRTLNVGNCHTFTALQVSASPTVYGWAMI